MLVTQTNLYATQFRRNNPNLSANARANLWVETTRDEIKKFIALSLLMGIGKTPEHRLFQPNLIRWSSEEEEEIHHSSSIEEFLEACDALTEVEGFDGNLPWIYFCGSYFNSKKEFKKLFFRSKSDPRY